MTKIKIGVLVSGGGSNLQALIDACMVDDFPAEIACVISNRKDANGLERAKQHQIPAVHIPSKDRRRTDFESDLTQQLKQHEVQLICLAGFMRILSGEFIDTWQGRILNIHPSLLPKFGGEGMYGHHVHSAVLAAGEVQSGASVHVVTAGCDEGPVIYQDSVPVKADDTPEILAARVLQVEHKIYPLAVKQYILERF